VHVIAHWLELEQRPSRILPTTMPRTPNGYSLEGSLHLRAVDAVLQQDDDDDGDDERDAFYNMSQQLMDTLVPVTARRTIAKSNDRALIIKEYKAQWRMYQDTRLKDNCRTIEALGSTSVGPHIDSISLRSHQSMDVDHERESSAYGDSFVSSLPSDPTIMGVDVLSSSTSVGPEFGNACPYTFCLPATKNRSRVDVESSVFIPHTDQISLTLGDDTKHLSAIMTDYLQGFDYPPEWRILKDPDGM
jgi:hypothetical protein